MRRCHVLRKTLGSRLATVIATCGLFCFSSISSFAVGNITLAWDASSDPSVVAYRVHYGAATGVYTNSVSAGGATTVTVSNLLEGVRFYFAATAVDTNGLESDFSNEVSGSVPLPNQPPTLSAIGSLTIREDAGLQVVNLSGIGTGATNEVQTLVITATSSNLSLIPNPSVTYTSPNSTGYLSFTAVSNAFGSATINVTVNDGGPSNNLVSRTFVVTVSPVNDTPTLNVLTNITINENAGLQTVNLSGISSGAANETGTLTVTATSSNPGLIPNPTVSYTSPNAAGSITFTPVASAFGSANITVTVNDGGSSNNIVQRQFTVTVNHLNQAPTITAITNRVIAVDTTASGIAFTIGDAETSAPGLTLSGASDNQGLVPNANITFGGVNASRTVTVRPAAGQTGVARITVTVSDGTTNSTSSFQLSVRLRPAPPGGVHIVGQ